MSSTPNIKTTPPDAKEQLKTQETNLGNNQKDRSPLWESIKKKIEGFLEHNVFVIFMTFITIYALFADDVRQLIDDKSVDDGFFAFTSVCLGLFAIEILLSSLAKPGYFFGFFFWLDIMSTLSLILDIGWLSDLIFGTGDGAAGAAGAAQLARAGRASRVGTRAGRIVRVVRLIRLIRIVKLYKAAQTTLAQKRIQEINEEEEEREGTTGKSNVRKTMNNLDAQPSVNVQPSMNNLTKKATLELPIRKGSNETPERKSSFNDNNLKPQNSIDPINDVKSDPKILGLSATDNVLVQPINTPATAAPRMEGTLQEQKTDEEKKLEIPQETNVGKKLSDLTTKRVITLVMSVMLSIPIFSVETYVSDYTSGESGLKSLFAMNQTGDSIAYSIALKNYIKEHKDIRNPLVVVNVLENLELSSVNEDSLRDSEKQYYNIQNATSGEVTAYSVFDQRDDTHLNAILSISRTFFVTAVLTAAALFFSKDSNDLVLAPIESMLAKVKRIAENPLAAAQIEEEDALLQEKLEKEGKLKDLKKDQGNYETNILEKTILKLGALLALGFGEAGSNIIAQNMSKSGDVDPMIPGKKVLAIFGFCDIRQFTDATEVLQEGVMVFVNEIAEIVHGTINEFSGAANKNIGDAFLLVWKFPDDCVEVDSDDSSSLRLNKGSIKVGQLADMSVISFLKVWAGINKSKKLEKYRHHEGLNQRIKNYSVKMGFGLHVGWAIEGAIGSEYKIDASYLSPNVNMASRLEAATKQFGVPLLISGALYTICTPETQKHLRHIDRVTVKGSIQPIDLYTCDVDHTRLSVNQNEVDLSNRSATEKKQARVEARIKKDDFREKAFSGKIKVSKKFITDKDILAMRKPFTAEFEAKFKEGMEHYISGNWTKSRDLFEYTLKMLPNREKDGPSNTLLNYMSEFGYRAPHDWKGFRELTEK